MKREKAMHGATSKKTVKRPSGILQKVIAVPEVSIIVFILLFVLIIAVISDTFFTTSNILLISKQVAINGILAIAVAITILSGGLDLSVGSMLGAVCVCAGALAKDVGLSYGAVFVLTVLIGAAAGAINGIAIVGFSIQPIIVTLGTLNIFKGVSLVLTNGKWYTGLPAAFKVIGQGYTPFAILVALTVVMSIVMRRTKFGRHIYAVGGNETSARLAGIHVSLVKFLVYVLSGALVGIATMVYLGRAGAATATAGSGYETEAMAAAVVGGVSFTGGRGSVTGAFLGTVLMGILLNALVAVKVSAYYQGIVTGLVIVLALIMETARGRYLRGARQ